MDQNKQPGGVSKLCLSCHDGNVAVNNYGRVQNGAGNGDDASTGVFKGDAPVFIVDDYKIGKNGDLSNHHPIGFDYVTVYNTDDEIQSIGSNFTVDKSGATVYTIGDLLWGGKMECTTCHDVHNTKNQGEKFLWKSDVQSALCLTCHVKDGAIRN
jgi:predicted CXXCH cytochrome family protein